MSSKLRLKLNKSAQIKMSETIAVIFIFFILIVFGMIFFYQYQKVSFNEKQAELLSMKAIDITSKVLFLPELVCSDGRAELIKDCLDLLKLNAAKDVFSATASDFSEESSEDYYFKIFSYARIKVYELYSNQRIIAYDNGEEKSWTLYDRPKTDEVKPEIKNTYFVVSLKNGDDYGFGYLEVGVYS